TTGQHTLLTPKGGAEPVSYGGGRDSTNRKGLYVTTDRDAEFHRLAYLDLATKQHTYLTGNLAWGVEEFDLSRDGKWLAFVTNDDGVSVLHVLETASGQERPVPKFPLGVIGGLQWHANSTDLGLTFESVRTPADVYSYNIIMGTVERWTSSETGGLNTANLPEPELVRWKSFDGHALSGFLYRPPARFSGKRPVALNIHGGPESQARPHFLARHTYWLNELGVALLYPNIRGSAGYGKTFLKLDNGRLREDAYKDVGALLDWIRTRPDLDRIRPRHNADKLKKPLFVVQGRNDPRVPVSEAEQMVSTVRKNGTPVWYLLAKDEGHGFAKKKNVDYLFYASVLFIQECLLK